METDRIPLSSGTNYKAFARTRLLTHYGATVGATLLYGGIYMILVTLLTPASDTPSVLLLNISSIVISLFTSVLSSGHAFLYLNLVYERPVASTQLFYGFSSQPAKAVGIQVVFVIASLLSGVPLMLYETIITATVKLPVSILFLILSQLILMALTLPFSQAFYLLQDHPGRSVRALLKASMRLMRGHYLQLFLLKLSFLPLLVVSCLAMFVPFLWLTPYYQATMAAFYRELMTTHRTMSPALEN